MNLIHIIQIPIISVIPEEESRQLCIVLAFLDFAFAHGLALFACWCDKNILTTATEEVKNLVLY